jgi:hypothetical protein
MTFEEFFKKKRIDLAAMQQGEPALFSEFKIHFEQMGEKSFDHTKKYWFNKLRLQFVLAPEIKTEKVKIDNPLAEQTITETLDELASIAPSLGFKSKFRAATPPKPATDQPEETKTESPAEPAAAPAPKLGFTPKFRAANPPKPVVENTEEAVPPATTESTPPAADDNPAPKPAYKPRFNIKNIPPKKEEE